MFKNRRTLRYRENISKELSILSKSIPKLIAITYCEDELGMTGDDLGIDSEYFSYCLESPLFKMEFILYLGKVFEDYFLDMGILDEMEIPNDGNPIEYINDQLRRM